MPPSGRCGFLSDPARTVVGMRTSSDALRGDLVPTAGRFEVVSEYKPSGDQPAAISDLERRIRAGE